MRHLALKQERDELVGDGAVVTLREPEAITPQDPTELGKRLTLLAFDVAYRDERRRLILVRLLQDALKDFLTLSERRVICRDLDHEVVPVRSQKFLPGAERIS